jgi:hypothetical protein
MMQRLFHLLDQVQDRWPRGASLRLVQLRPLQPWAIESARALISGWSPADHVRYRVQFTALVEELALLHRRWAVATALALLLGLTVAMAALGGGQLTDDSAGVLAGVLSAILLPPYAICYGIARDHQAAQAILAACRAHSARR